MTINTERRKIETAIFELCSKAQYDHATYMAEPYVRSPDSAEWALTLLGYVQCMSGDFYEAIMTLSQCQSKVGLYLRAFCYSSLLRRTESLRILDELSKDNTTEEIQAEHSLESYSIKASAIESLKAYCLAGANSVTTEALKRNANSVEFTPLDIKAIVDHKEAFKYAAASISGSRDAKRARLHQNRRTSHPFSSSSSNPHLEPRLFPAADMPFEIVAQPEDRSNCPYHNSYMGKRLYETRSYTQAKQFYDRVIDHHPHFTSNMEDYPLLLWHLKDEGRLQFAFEKWRHYSRTRYLALIAIGNLMSLRQSHELAIKFFAKAHSVCDPKRSQHLVCMGFEYLTLDNMSLAEECFARASKGELNGGKPWLGLGIINYKRDQLGAAERYFKTAASLLIHDPAPNTYLASIYFKQRRLKDCILAADRSLTLYPEDLRALYIKASVLSDLGKDDDALVILNSIKALEPLDPTSHVLISEHLAKMGRKAAAIKSYCFALDLDPQSAIIPDGLQSML